jgi:hypothetical protein
MRMGGQRHAPTALPLGKGPSTHCVGGLGGAGLKAGLDNICVIHFISEGRRIVHFQRDATHDNASFLSLNIKCEIKGPFP